MELQSAESTIVFDPQSLENNPDTVRKPWYHYLPLCGKPYQQKCCPDFFTMRSDLGTMFLILAPHPSLLYVLVDFHLLTLRQRIIFITHLLVTYTLTFMALSSLIVCLARDPGPANAPPSRLEGADGEGEEIRLREALMPDNDFTSPGRWCRKCWVGTNDFTIGPGCL
jgi:palmitoyltransferase